VAAARLSLLGEHISEDAALAAMNERSARADLLLRFARKRIRSEQAVAMARSATLARRVERILESDASRRRAGFFNKATLATTLLPFVAIAERFQAQDDEPSHGIGPRLETFEQQTNNATPVVDQ
jgi:hypothetical protein